MNDYFINITKTLNLKTLDKSQVDTNKFENYVSIKEMHETFPEIIPGRLHFEQLFSDIIRKKCGTYMLKNLQHMVRFRFDFKTMC